MKRVAILIDGGFLRARARMAKKTYNPSFIEKFALRCPADGEEVIRVLYYDCAPYTGTAKLPVSGCDHEFHGSDAWLHELSRKDLFAVRRGVLKFRGFKPKHVPVAAVALTDNDFCPDFEQKGVDMRIGLDIATLCQNRAVDRIILVSGDTDCIPAMKHGRRAGIQIVLVELPGVRLAPELLSHADFKRAITWP
jgi:uncharacterized LabA/DUF88 family protein